MISFPARCIALVLVFSGVFATQTFAAPPPPKNTPTPLPVPLESTPATSEGAGFFGDLDQQEVRAEKDYEAKYERGRMGFLFGFYDRSRELWTPLANDGYAKAQANLGWMYQTGKGVKKDLKQAFEWYSKAAAHDHVIAKNNLGVMYEKGWGTKQNLQRAAYWYGDAANSGYSYAQFNFGKMLLDGSGVDKSPKEAAYWLSLASIQGVNEAKSLLADKTKWGAEQHKQIAELKLTEASSKQAKRKEVLREPWIHKQPGSSYTLQLVSSKEERVVTHYLSGAHIPDPSTYFKSMVLGEEWYSVIYGVFPTFEAAQQHMKLLPPGITVYKPWIRKYADVQNAIQNPIE